MNKHQMKQPVKKVRKHKQLANSMQVALVKSGACDVHQLRYMSKRFQ